MGREVNAQGYRGAVAQWHSGTKSQSPPLRGAGGCKIAEINLMNHNHLNQFLSSLPTRLFFLFIFLFLFFFTSHIFFYQEKTSLFVFSLDFLKDNLRQPGGLLVYLGKFLTTFFYYPFAGALIASLVIWLIVILASEITKQVTDYRRDFLPLLAGLALFYLQLDYRYLLYNNLGILCQLLFFLLSVKYLKSFLPVLLSPFLFYVTGGFTWIFLIMFPLWLLIKKPEKWWMKISALWLVSFLVIWISKEFLFFQSAGNLIQYPLTSDGTGLQMKIFLPVAVILSFLPALSILTVRNPLRKRFSQNLLSISGVVLLLVTLIPISIFRSDRKTQHYFHVEKLFYESLYQDIIDFNIKHPSNNILTVFLNNIALCETGQLNDRLFSFRQSTDGGTLFLKWDIAGEISRRGGYFYYTIGMINDAHRWAFENMVTRGLTPEGLKLIIKSEIINGNYKTAQKYNSTLRKTLFYRNDAREFEKLLFNDHAVDSYPVLGEKRRIKIQTDFISITEDPIINVERILSSDSLNSKAYEYKLAWLLLKKDYQGISAQLKNLEQYGFRKIPVHMEEAAVAIKLLYTGQLPSPDNLTINPDTEMRFERFLQTFQANGNDLRSAEPELRKQFGNTFWYWTFYH